jgi:VCBS repeat-containing protein
MTKKAPAPKNLEFTIGYNAAKNFLVTNEDARGADAWKIDFAKLLGLNAAVFSGMKDFTITSNAGSVFSVSKGVVKYDAGTKFDYLAAGQTAVDTVSYTVKLPLNLSATLKVKYLIQGRNDAPKVAAPLTGTVSENDGNQGFNLLSGASDVDAGAKLRVENVVWKEGSSGGLPPGFQIDAAGVMTYDPDQFDHLNDGEQAKFTFTYDVVDEHGAKAQQTATVTVNGVSDTAPPNRAPIVTPWSVTVSEGDAFGMDMRVNAFDPDFDTFHPENVVWTGATAGGPEMPLGFSIGGTAIIFNDRTVPVWDSLNEGETREFVFTYDVVDEHGARAAQTATFIVEGKNDAPVARADSFDFTEDQPLLAASVLVNDTDVDAGAVLTASLVSDVKHGTLEFLSDGTFVYTPDKDYAGIDTFTYRAFDGKAYSEVVTVTLNGVEAPEPVQTYLPTAAGFVNFGDYAPGDHYQETFDYDAPYDNLDATYRQDFSDSLFARASDSLQAANLFTARNFDHGPERIVRYDGQDPSQEIVGYYESSQRTDYIGITQSLLEFGLPMASGLVSGATLRFNSFRAEASEGFKAHNGTFTFDFYVYAGDGKITTSDFNAGVLAASVTVENHNGRDVEVTLASDKINEILAEGADYIGINIRSALADPGYTHDIDAGESFQSMQLSASTSRLDFFYV